MWNCFNLDNAYSFLFRVLPLKRKTKKLIRHQENPSRINRLPLQMPILSPHTWKKQWVGLKFCPLQMRTSLSIAYEKVKMNIKIESQFLLRM